VESDRARLVEERWVNVLAHVWNQVRWGRIRGRRPLDVFEHRLEYAKYEPRARETLGREEKSLGATTPRRPPR
jgi:hypothetical protein